MNENKIDRGYVVRMEKEDMRIYIYCKNAEQGKIWKIYAQIAKYYQYGS